MKLSNLQIGIAGILVFLLHGMDMFAQRDQEPSNDRRIIIIEEYTDENGNKVTKRTEKYGDDTEIIIHGDDVHVYEKEYDDRTLLNDLDEHWDHLEIEIENLEDCAEKVGEDLERAFEGAGEEFEEWWENRGDHWFWNQPKDREDERGFPFGRSPLFDPEPRPYLGIVMNNGGEGEVVISRVTEHSAASEAGLKKGDVLLEIDGEPIEDIEEVQEIIGEAAVGNSLRILYERNGETRSTSATLKERAPRFLQEGENRFKYPNHKYRFENKGISEEKKCKLIGVYTHFQENEDGLEIIKVIPGTAAEEAGLKKGDVIKAVGNTPVTSHKGLAEARDSYEPGSEMSVEIAREGKIMVLAVKRYNCQEKVDMGLDQESLRFENNLRLEEFNAFPNPAKGFVNLNFTGEAVPTVVRINDVSGKEIYKKELPEFSGNFNQRLDLDDAPSGLLIINIQQGEKQFFEKLVNDMESGF